MYHDTHVRIANDLFERIKILAKKYHLSITDIVIELLEIGYINFLKEVKNESKSTNK